MPKKKTVEIIEPELIEPPILETTEPEIMPYRPKLPPKTGYIEREYNNEPRYFNVETGELLRKPDEFTVDELRQSKLTEISTICYNTIIAGVDVETSQGVEHFGLDINDQTNIGNLALQAQAGSPVLYHADDKLCRWFTPVEMLAIAGTAIAHKTYHTTYHNHLKQWVNNEPDIESLRNITYGVDLPAELADNMAMLLNNGGECK